MPSAMSRRLEDPAEEEERLRREREQQERGDERDELGERVVRAEDRPAEVEREDAVALVGTHELGGLGGDEEEEDRLRDRVVALVLDRVDRLRRPARERAVTPRLTSAGIRRRTRRPNGTIFDAAAAPDPERPAHRVGEERSGRRTAARGAGPAYRRYPMS